MKFEELFLWALDNQIGLEIHTRPLDYTRRQTKDNQTYHARFSGHNGEDIVGQEIMAINPEELLHICEVSLNRVYLNMTMKPLRSKKKKND